MRSDDRPAIYSRDDISRSDSRRDRTRCQSRYARSALCLYRDRPCIVLGARLARKVLRRHGAARYDPRRLRSSRCRWRDTCGRTVPRPAWRGGAYASAAYDRAHGNPDSQPPKACGLPFGHSAARQAETIGSTGTSGHSVRVYRTSKYVINASTSDHISSTRTSCGTLLPFSN